MGLRIDQLLAECTVQLNVSSTAGSQKGTGFLVAPGLILTCEHVVRGSEENSIQLIGQQQQELGKVAIVKESKINDLALLNFIPFFGQDLPCVAIDSSFQPGDQLYMYGYPDNFPEGTSVTADCEGSAKDGGQSLIKFKGGQFRPGISGSPVLNWRTGKVCGVVKFTLDRSSRLGGGAVPVETVLQVFPELKHLQDTFHDLDHRWSLSWENTPEDSPIIKKIVDHPDSSVIADNVTNSTIIHTLEFHIHTEKTDWINNPEILEIAKPILREELRVHDREYGVRFKAAVQLLADSLKNDPKVRASITTFRVEFQEACEQIDIITTYKALHDLLHSLDFQCYKGIVQLKILSDKTTLKSDETALELDETALELDETSLGILADHALSLQRFLQNAQEAAIQMMEYRCRKSPSIEPNAKEGQTLNDIHKCSEFLWLQDLETACNELDTALTSLKRKHLKNAELLLNHILAKQPNKINTNLITLVRTLQISPLVEAMNYISQGLVNSSLDQEKRSVFEEGVRSLEALGERLYALIIGHDYWQETDLTLKVIEDTINRSKDSEGLAELRLFWPVLQQRTETIFDITPDKWVKKFQEASRNLDDALRTDNPTKIKGCFRSYRRQAEERFYQVDVTLNRLCGELRQIGEPINSILRLIS